jgi:hypothetical protein
MKGAGIGAELPPVSTICPRSYGVVAGTHDADNMRVGPNNVSQIIWLVNVGDLILDSKPLVVSIDVRCNVGRDGRCVIPFIASASVLRDRANCIADSEQGMSSRKPHRGRCKPLNEFLAARDEQHQLQIEYSRLPGNQRLRSILAGHHGRITFTVEIRVDTEVNVVVTTDPSKTILATCSTNL